MSEASHDNGHVRDTVERALVAYYTATTHEPPDVAQGMWQLVAPWLIFAREGSSHFPAQGQGEAIATRMSPMPPVPARLRVRVWIARGFAATITLVLIVLLVMVVTATFRH